MKSQPVVISTWKHGLAANQAAWTILANGGRALDAVEAGVRVSEADPDVRSVGFGGRPDASGRVTLDACIMDEHGDCGSVACLEGMEHAISVARLVMEKTPHVMLVGEGAPQFALASGFAKKKLLTDRSREEWEKWKAARPGASSSWEINVENHDTIGMLAIDAAGNLSGACTTSGTAWKLPGRVGDSPIIGAGLFVDNAIGAACATGVGEAVIRAAGSHVAVESMRHGQTPAAACQLAIKRIIEKNPDWKNIQVGMIAINKLGQVGGYAIQPGFDFAICDGTDDHRLVTPDSHLGPSPLPS